MANKTFELNGKAYDALSGAFLGDVKRVPHMVSVQAMQPKAVPLRHSHSSQGSVDGIIGVRTTTSRSSDTGNGVSAAAKSVHQRTQPTKTLMRHAVKPPTPHLLHSKSKPGSDIVVAGLQSALSPRVPVAAPKLTAKLSSDVVDPMRARRARATGRSQTVQHFKPANQDLRRQYAASLTPPTRRPAPAVKSSAPPTHQPARQPSPQPPVQDDDLEQDLFSQALAHATSHQQVAPHESAVQGLKRQVRRRRQALGIAASLSVFLLLFGFIAFQNRDNVRLQLASAKAGFSAAVPLIKPAGYDMDKLSYAPGSVAMQYKGASDRQGFTITQKKSNWDSQTLLENFVATSNQDYQGYQSNGRTVYLYGKGNATWVNGGIWYQIKDVGNLSNEQLVKIAASM